MSLRRRIPLFRIAGLAAAAALLWGCIIGGTGTDTDNGLTETTSRGKDLSVAARVVDSAGHGVAGVTLTLRTPAFRPDLGLLAGNLLDSARDLNTDSRGSVKFGVAAAGKFVIEGALNGRILFFDTVVVADSAGQAPFTFIVQPARSFKGSVRLASGLRVDSGVIFVRGTGRFARLSPSGGYDLGDLPAEVALMSVGLRYRASATQFRVADQKAEGPVNVGGSNFTCREITPDSAAHIPANSVLQDGSGVKPDKASATQPAIDSAKVKAAGRSCDSLEVGTVVTVNTPETKTAGPDTLSASYVAVGDGAQPAYSSGPKLIPLEGCVDALASESTTFNLQLLSSASGSDALVGDISAACLAK